MAMMAKMRNLAPVFIITVGVLFVLFMIISDSNVMEVFGARTNNVGSVNGENISYVEFNKFFEQQMQARKDQLGRDLEDTEMDQVREQSWEAIVTQKLIADQIDKMGITVSDDEVREVILGNDPPEFLKQNFIDSTGNFNRALYDQAIQDPRNREPIVQAEEYVRQTKLSEKLQSMITASITVSESELKRKFIDQNITMEAVYALVDINKMPDAEFNVSEDELKDYYNKNLDKYVIKPQRRLKYVVFQTVPSADDSGNVLQGLENVVTNLKKDTSGFQSYVEIYSTEPYSKDTLSIQDFGSEASNLVQAASPGTVIGPVASPQGYAVYNFIGKVPSSETMVKVSHILINQFGSDEKNLEKANEIFNLINSGADFSKIALEYSADPGSAQRGGDLGWFGKGAMVPEFEKASFSGKVGELQKPVKTNYGYHLLKVTGKTSDKYVVEKIVNPVKISASTRDALYNAAKDFEYLADKNDFESEAELMQYQVQETPPFVEESYSIPGIGVNNNLLKFAFDGSLNDISPVHKISSGYVVAKISEIIKEGAQEFEKIKEQIKPAVIKEKKIQKAAGIAEDIAKKINGNISNASKLSNFVTVDSTGSFSGLGSIRNIGKDYAFIAKAQELEMNKVSAPFKGNRGYFIIQVLKRTPFDQSSYEMQKDVIRQTILQEKKSSFFSQWLINIKKEADITDNRYMFYGY